MEDGKPHYTNHIGDINEMAGCRVAAMGFWANLCPSVFIPSSSRIAGLRRDKPW
jgi:hypothetical protein